MPQEKLPSGLAAETRELFADAIKEGEELKVRVGQKVFLNDSSAGKPQDRLTDEILSSIKDAIAQDNGDRVSIPLAESGNTKTPEIEVVAVSGKGKEGERLLFRQEKGLAISVNEVADLAQQRSTESVQPVATVEGVGKEVGSQEPLTGALDHIQVQDGTIELQNAGIELRDEIIEEQDKTITAQDSTIAFLDSSLERIDQLHTATIETQNSTINALSSALKASSQTTRDRNPNVSETKVQSEPLAAPNAVDTLGASVEKLPESKTKALWQRVAADFQQLNTQLKDIHQKNKEIISAVAEAPKAIKQDADVLVQKTGQRLADIRQNLQTRVTQTSLNDIASAAITGGSLAVDAGSKGLGRASHYLKDRADKVKSYGMAKAALRVYDKGHNRTGESIFKAEGYTVEALTDGYKVKDQRDRLIMSFATDDKGKPVSITKSASIQPADYKKLNQASKLPVIEGSPKAEADYSQRITRLAGGVKLAVPENESRNGPNFFVSREDDRITVATQGHPRREMVVDPSGGSHSNLTIADMDKLEDSIVKAINLQDYREELLNQKPEKVEKLDKVGVEIG